MAHHQHRHRAAAGSAARLRGLIIAAVVVMTAAMSAGSPAFAVGARSAIGDARQRGLPVAATAATPGPTKPGYSKLVDSAAVLQPALAAGSGRRTVFVQLVGPGAAEVSADLLAKGQSPATVRLAVQARRAAVDAGAAALAAAAVAADPEAVTVFRVANAVPGLGLTADSAALRALARRPEVEKISAIIPKTPANAGAAQLTRTLQTWTDLSVTGAGVRVGVIDTGIDYTHADFGGPGTPAAYLAARAAGAGRWTPTAKVVGGRDFVGDDYDAAPTTSAGTTNTAYQPVPHPDADPLDCNGHGTHVAGTIAGLGVGPSGQTFTGDYSALSGADLYSMKVGPGMAPKAALYALKVFGCSGATDAVIPALDWALDPNGDGTFADHLDVVDLSLTGGQSVVDDPETTVLDEVARLGVLPVVAAGNAGDETDAAGSAAASTRSLVVASSMDAYQHLDGLTAQLPGRAAQAVAGQVSRAYPWQRSADVTGQVVSLSAADGDGCAPLSPADAAKVAGRVAWLVWDEDDSTRLCGSAVRSANVLAAGAIGAVLTSSAPVFAAAISGDPSLPVFQLTPTATAALQAGVDHGLTVTFSAGLIGGKPEIDDSITDMIESVSARGPHGVPGVVKPDVAAPGATISSALMGSGAGSALRSGTSSAAAEIAGVAALVRAARPSWSPEQIKAAVMNTADHDVYPGADLSGPALGPARVGAGRVDAEYAVTTRLLAYSSTTPGAVSVSFGVVPAAVNDPTVAATAAVVVQNTGADAAALTLSYRSLVDQPGVSYQISPAGMTLPAGASALATVTMSIVPADLRHTLDPGTPAQQRDVLTGLDEARQYVAAASGRLLVSAPGVADLRVPVYGAAKPVASTSATDGTLDGAPALVLAGTGLSLASPTDSASTAYNSLVSVLDLGYRSTRIPACSGITTRQPFVASPTVSTIPQTAGSSAQTEPSGCSLGGDPTGDLQAVGVGRVQPSGTGPGNLWFGLSTYGDWATVGKSTFPTVNIDTNGDNTADYTVQVQTVGDSDLLYALLFDDKGAGSLIDMYPVNFNLGNVDTNVFDTNVLLIPVDPAAIGYRPSMSTFPIRYSVATYSAQGAPQNGAMVDTTPAIEFDVARPAITTAAPLWRDQGGAGIPYQLAPGRSNADALVLHLHGASGARAQIVGLRGAMG